MWLKERWSSDGDASNESPRFVGARLQLCEFAKAVVLKAAAFSSIFLGDLGTLLASFGETDGDGLFAALDRAALARFERAVLPSAHRAFYGLACSLSVFSSP